MEKKKNNLIGYRISHTLKFFAQAKWIKSPRCPRKDTGREPEQGVHVASGN